MGEFFTLPAISDYTSIFSFQRKRTLFCAEVREEEGKKKQNSLLFSYCISKFQLDEFQLKYPKGE